MEITVSQAGGSGGGSTGPTEFVQNGSTVNVTQDTSTPANNIPLPVINYDASGNVIVPATAAKQDTGNTSLASIDTKTPGLGQALAAASTPVVLTALQVTALTPPTTVTANQGTAGASAWKVDGSAVTQPISAASLPLPTGAATSANQGTEITALQATQALLQDVFVTGAGPATQVINTNILLAVTGTTSVDMLGYRSIAFQIVTGASTNAVSVNFEGSNDNVNFVSLVMYDKALANGAPVSTITTAASTTRYFEGPVEMRYFRVRLVAAITAGTIQAFSVLRTSPYVITNLSLAAGTQNIGSLVALGSITQPLPVGTNVLGFTKQGGRTLANAPIVNQYGSTSIGTVSYVQLVASTTAAVTYLDIFDTSGQPMILATGGSGSEVILAYIPPGGAQIAVNIAASTRIAYKALTTTAASGYLLMNFWG